ncbi:hypothetical protein JHK86_000879 [Glycine max]|nr:hypothetical protein JHK86_000879 [Glycine max]
MRGIRANLCPSTVWFRMNQGKACGHVTFRILKRAVSDRQCPRDLVQTKSNSLQVSNISRERGPSSRDFGHFLKELLHQKQNRSSEWDLPLNRREEQCKEHLHEQNKAFVTKATRLGRLQYLQSFTLSKDYNVFIYIPKNSILHGGRIFFKGYVLGIILGT